MSILETFYILFKSDTSELKKGSDEALKTTQQLNKSLKDTDEISGKIGSKFLSMVAPLTAIVASFASVSSIISGFKNTLDYDIDLGKTSRALGVNVEQLDMWDNAVKNAGGTAEGFQASLRNLSEHFNTNPSVALKFLPQLADVFSKISRFSAFKLGKSLGLDEATILLLQQGRREVQAVLNQQKELGVVTKKDIEVTTEYNKSVMNLEHGFRTLYNSIINPLLPGLTKFFDLLTKGLSYLTLHKDVVIGAFVGIGAAAISAGIAFGLITAEVALLTLGVLVAIAAFALLWEDTQVYFKGGKSLIGEYIDEWKRLDKIIVDSLDTWIDKLVKFLDKFRLLKGVARNILSSQLAAHNSNNLFDFVIQHELINAQLKAASSSPLNNRPSNVVNSSLFNRDNNIHIAEINMEIQSNDAQGVAYGLRAELQRLFSIHTDQAQGNFSDNVGY